MLELSALDLAPAPKAKTTAPKAGESDSRFAKVLEQAQATEKQQKLAAAAAAKEAAQDKADAQVDAQAEDVTAETQAEDEQLVEQEESAAQAADALEEAYAMAMLAVMPQVEPEASGGAYTAALVDEITTEENGPRLDLSVETPQEGDGVPEEFAALLENAVTLDLENLPLEGTQNSGGDLADFHRLIEGITFEQPAEPSVEPVMTRLQQAVGASFGGAVLEEAAEVVLPQVLRGLTAMARDAMSEMRLQLQPADLGEIEIRVRAIEGMVRSEILVQHSEVKNLLESQVDRLRTALSEQGLEFAGLDVRLAQDGNPWSEGGFGQPNGGQSGAGTAGDGTAVDGQAAAQVLIPSGAREVDYLA
jgi:flagellar hook-length control protein FliK